MIKEKLHGDSHLWIFTMDLPKLTSGKMLDDRVSENYESDNHDLDNRYIDKFTVSNLNRVFKQL